MLTTKTAPAKLLAVGGAASQPSGKVYPSSQARVILQLEELGTISHSLLTILKTKEGFLGSNAAKVQQAITKADAKLGNEGTRHTAWYKNFGKVEEGGNEEDLHER